MYFLLLNANQLSINSPYDSWYLLFRTEIFEKLYIYSPVVIYNAVCNVAGSVHYATILR